MARVFNFAAGPSMLPQPVLERIHAEFYDYHGTGISPLEMGHRTPYFAEIADECEHRFRRLLSIPDDYAVLYMPGGATLQYSAIPLNFLGSKHTAAYIDTGHWSKRAIAEARKYADVHVFSGLDATSWQLSGDEAYLHFVDNETIDGIEFDAIPEVGLPLVCDMSSNILTRPFDVSRFALVYAGAQKNLGIPGLGVVIVRRDMLGKAHPLTPKMCDYSVFDATGSMQNTAPTFVWYVLNEMLRYVEDQGGTEAMARAAKAKSVMLYEAIDASSFYLNSVDRRYRSRINIPFQLADEHFNDLFLQQAQVAGLAYLKGHRALGGMRASIYNAMPQVGVEALVSFMQAFENEVNV